MFCGATADVTEWNNSPRTTQLLRRTGWAQTVAALYTVLRLCHHSMNMVIKMCLGMIWSVHFGLFLLYALSYIWDLPVRCAAKGSLGLKGHFPWPDSSEWNSMNNGCCNGEMDQTHYYKLHRWWIKMSSNGLKGSSNNHQGCYTNLEVMAKVQPSVHKRRISQGPQMDIEVFKLSGGFFMQTNIFLTLFLGRKMNIFQSRRVGLTLLLILATFILKMTRRKRWAE